MKTAYFTDETINKKASFMFNKVKQIRDKHPINFNFEQSALLILDMQKYFLEPQSHAFIPSTQSIIEKICTIKNEFHKKNHPVILTKHINTKDNAKLMATWWKELITIDNPLSQVIPQLNHPSNIIIEKSQYDGFYQTKLEEILNKHSIKQLIITGVMTHLCVETTARSAFTRGYTVFIPIDGTATYNETFHNSTIYNLSHGFAYPTLMNTLIQQIKETK